MFSLNTWDLETERSTFYFSSSTKTSNKLLLKIIIRVCKNLLEYNIHIRHVKLDDISE